MGPESTVEVERKFIGTASWGLLAYYDNHNFYLGGHFMELDVAIKHILDGNAVILMGSGASCGASNSCGNIPSAWELTKELYELCGLTLGENGNLQEASQTYQELFSAESLIAVIKEKMTCFATSEEQDIIYSLPWMRYYTTNYDDVALMAAKKSGIHITPVTLSSAFKRYREYNHLCIHINGHVGNLNEDTLNNEFKLTSNSYLSQDNIMRSPWGKLLNADLESAKCVVIVGLSLRSDLDIGRIIYGADTTSKTIIIDRPDLPEDALRPLSRFGTVYMVGVDGFAEEIKKIRNSYVPKVRNPVDELYTCFLHEYHRTIELTPATPSEVFSLFLSGQYTDSLFYKERGHYSGLIQREAFQNIKTSVLTGKKYIFIRSDMGNGKTASLQELRTAIANEDIHIFILQNADQSRLASEVHSICQIESPVLIIIDNYPSFMEVLRRFSVENLQHIQFVLTARTALNYSKMHDVIRMFHVRENESTVIDVNVLSASDITNCIDFFDRFGLFGKHAGLSRKEKRRYLGNRKGGNRRFQSILLDTFKSAVMQNKVQELVKTIGKNSTKFHGAVILILLVQTMNLRVSVKDIEEITDLDISTDALFRSDEAIMELLSFDKGSRFKLKSPITARYILREISDPNTIIDSLCTLADYASQFAELPKYDDILAAVISYSHISSFLLDFHNKRGFLSTYYDRLSQIEYYQKSHFFWLQYSISCMELKDYPRAQQYIDTARGLIPAGFVPFQINNQQARLYLEIICEGKSNNPLTDFQEAHSLLMQPIVSERDNEYNVVRLFNYYCKKQLQSKLLCAPEEKAIYKDACRSAYNRISNFIRSNPGYNIDLKETCTGLLKCYSME